MIDDHTKVADQMKQTLQQAKLPEPPAQLPPEQQALLDKLKNKNGAAFDRSYFMDQLSGHRKAAHLIGSYARSGKNLALRKLAKETLPVVPAIFRTSRGSIGSSGVPRLRRRSRCRG